MSEDEIRVQILEQMFEHHWREASAMSRCLRFAQDHYTYRDAQRAHQMAAEWCEREHVGILKYAESQKRLRHIYERIAAEHESKLAQEKIA